ncbi:cell division protein ZapA [Gallaecimonas sp. GXIMD4217]|uniref:cell division protein ZapA n=1 Tax=Gallaecimonas sp. GXIMD4217 TaxID=3131927 RepID=UPI00311B159C
MTADAVDIVILGRRHHVACPPGQEDALRTAAANLESRLLDLRSKADLQNREQLLTLVALNLSHELLLAEGRGREYAEAMDRKIKVLQDTIEQALIGKTTE